MRLGLSSPGALGKLPKLPKPVLSRGEGIAKQSKLVAQTIRPHGYRVIISYFEEDPKLGKTKPIPWLTSNQLRFRLFPSAFEFPASTARKPSGTYLRNRAAKTKGFPMKRTAGLIFALVMQSVIFAAAGQCQSFVGKQGTKFVYQGNNITFYGSTFFPSPIGGTSAWHTTTFPTYIDQMIALAQQAGQNILRPTDYWDKSTPNQNPQDPVVWSNMDHLVSACKAHGMFVLMDISAFKWLLTANGQNITDPNNWSSFIDFVAARYRNEPTVAFWSIMGEPAVPTTSSEADSLVAFYDAVTTRLRTDDPNHLIAAGAFNHMEDHPEFSWWQRIYSLANNDVPGYKTYSQNDLNLIPTITNFTNSISKPAVDEEFGMPQDTGDCSFSGTSFNSINTDRADFFKNVYNGGLAGGVVGFQFWNLGNEVTSTSFEVSSNFPCLWAVLQQFSPPAQPPMGLSATATSSSEIDLSWNANAETTVTGYNVYRSVTSGFTPSSANRIAAGVTTTSFANTGLAAATTYFYLVTAINQLGKESGPSHQASATTQAGGPPPAPTNLTATAGNTQVSLSWTASSGASSYHVKRATVSGGPYTTVGSPTATSFTDSGLNNGTTYFYVVTAVNAAGESGNSNQASATPQAGTIKAISIDFVGNGVTPMGSAESAGVVAKTNWNNAAGSSGTGQALHDETGAATSAKLSWTADHLTA